MCQPAAVVEQVVDAAAQEAGAEGLVQIGVCACGISLFLVARAVFGREQDDGDMARADVLLHEAAQGDSVHHGHHDVAHDDVGDALAGDVPSLLSVGSGEHFVAVFERGAYVFADVFVVFHHEQDGAVVVCVSVVGLAGLCCVRFAFGVCFLV